MESSNFVCQGNPPHYCIYSDCAERSAEGNRASVVKLSRFEFREKERFIVSGVNEQKTEHESCLMLLDHTLAIPYYRSERYGRIHVVTQEGTMTAPAFGSVVLYVHDDTKTILDFYCAAFGLTIRYYNATAQFGELETGATSLAVAAHSAGTLMVG